MDTLQDEVVLVDATDVDLGTASKRAAHEGGLLHRAFSVFVFDGRGRLLLQRRAENKYHSAGLWTNTCCSHPRPGEPVENAAHRRLREEMGFDCPLSVAFSFVYYARLEAGMIEHELDHVLLGRWEGDPAPDASEVQDWAWTDVEELRRELSEQPARYSAWLPIALRELVARGLLPG